MPRRAPQTLADYMVVGISPALVMFMVGSLLWFLTIVFYQGDYTWRLLLVHAMFIMGCVSVTRLSMEEGAAYAALFAFPLAVVVAVAYVTFVRVEGTLAAISPLVNLMLEAVIWFSAHKLTWDCTLIDDTQDSSKQGLLQAMGWDRAQGEIAPPPSPQAPAPTEDAAVSEPSAEVGPATTREGQIFDWLKSLFRPDRRPHTPGVWIVYFSLAALPLFGIGQWFIPSDQIELRRQAFWLLVVYVACGLGLLLNTSFLGLRRYLRQRNLLMPTEMAATWLGVGATMIVAVLLLVWLLPRPSAEYSVSQLDMFKSKPLDPSRWGWGKDGTKQPGETKQTPASGDGGQKSDQGQSSKQGDSKSKSGGRGKGTQEGGKGDGEKSSGGEKSDGGKSSGGKGTGKDKSSDGSKNKESGSDAKKGDRQSGDKSDDAGGKQKAFEKDDKKSNSKSDAKSQSPDDKSPQQSGQENQSSQEASQSEDQSSQEKSPDESQESSSTSPDSASPPPPSSPSRITQWLSQISPTLGQIIQWIFYVLVILTLIALAVIYRAQIMAAWKKLVAELRALWARWFGGPQPIAAADPVPAAVPPRPFSSYADPFSSGMAGRATVAELVRYTFEALEAWGREHDAPRTAGQTAHEYARQLGEVHQPLAREVRFLAELYGQLAYAQSAVRRPNVEPLRSLWEQMRLGPAGG
jgi:hypothetical protein